MNLDDTRVDRTLIHSTGPGTWLAGAAVGVVLALGLLLAGTRYVQVARGDGLDTGAVARHTPPSRVATRQDARGCELDDPLCNRKCSAC